jgi:hypothetical protein
MVPSGIKLGKEQLKILAYADGIALTFWHQSCTFKF